jgi:hypothetical protein
LIKANLEWLIQYNQVLLQQVFAVAEALKKEQK